MSKKLTLQQLELLNTASAYNGEQHKAICGKAALELIEYKKIEEELGIDLDVLFKASKGIVVYNESKTAIQIDVIPTIDLFNKRLIVYTGDLSRPYKTLYFKDYGKTWALTKEELE